jgi:hypothetical protein
MRNKDGDCDLVHGVRCPVDLVLRCHWKISFQEDEVTAELRVRQRELRELSDRNRNALHALCEKARKRIHQQRLAEQLNAIDREVRESSWYSNPGI